ncbi:MAG: universal stress protein [Thermoplasmata archaeon]|nr:universal stress protein [Thermoplasmata archaeon]
MYRKIVVAVDGSESGERAFLAAADLAKTYDAELSILSVVPPHVAYAPSAPFPAPVTDEEMAAVRHLVETSADKAKRRGVRTVKTAVVEGVVVDRILEAVEREKPDLLVVGARGLSRSARLFLGSTSDGLVHHSLCPVLVVKAVR